MYRLASIVALASYLTSTLAAPHGPSKATPTNSQGAYNPSSTYNPNANSNPAAQGLDPNLGGPVSPLNRKNPVYTDQQLNDIKLKYTTVDRLAYIASLGNTDDYFKFDFTSAGFSSNAGKGQGGYGFLADVKNYPVMMGTGLSMAIGYLQPCGLDSMHVHNRATEVVILVAGKSLYTGFAQEDGFTTPVLTELGLYQGTIRPQGAIHYEFNDNCEPAIFVAGLSNEDPGVARTAPLYFAEDPTLTYADLGYPGFLKNVNLTQFGNSIPAAFALGAQQCLQRCGITYNATAH